MKLGDAIAEQMKDSEPVKSSQEEVKTEEPKAQDEKPQVVEETKQEEVAAFAEKVDTKGMTPEQLEEVYHNWNKAYTQKRQKEAAELKAMQKELEELRQLRAQSPTANVSNNNGIQSQDLKQVQDEAKKQLDLGNLTLEEYTQYITGLAAEEARRATENFITEREDQAYQKQALNEFNSLDERFSSEFIDPNSPTFNETNAWMYQTIAKNMADALDAHIEQYGSSIGFDTKGVAKQYIKQLDSYIDNLVRSRVQTSNAKAEAIVQNNARSIPRGTNTKSSPTGTKDLRSILSENVS